MLCQDNEKGFSSVPRWIPRQFRNSHFKPSYCAAYATKDLLLQHWHSEPCLLPSNFSFAIHPLVYRCPNHSVIVCIAKKASKGRSLGTQMECESDFFFFVFGIPYFQKHFPSNPMVVVFACYAFSVPNILLRHSKGTFVTFYRSSFSST